MSAEPEPWFRIEEDIGHVGTAAVAVALLSLLEADAGEEDPGRFPSTRNTRARCWRSDHRDPRGWGNGTFPGARSWAAGGPR